MSYWEREAEIVMGENARLEDEISRLKAENALLKSALATPQPAPRISAEAAIELLKNRIERLKLMFAKMPPGPPCPCAKCISLRLDQGAMEEVISVLKQPAPVTACGRCGGKGYIQSTPRTFDTDSASECIDALLMARRDCPDCKPQATATAPDEVQREQQPRRTEEEEEEEVNAYIRSETDDNGQLLYPNYGLKAAPNEVQRLRDALKAMAKEYRDLDLPYGSAAYVKAMAALNDTGFEFGMAAYGLRETEAQPAPAADAEPIYCRRVCGRIAERGVICNTCRAESETKS